MDELFSEEERQYIVNAIDTHVRQHGINVAQMGVLIAMKLKGTLSVPDQSGKEPDGSKD